MTTTLPSAIHAEWCAAIDATDLEALAQGFADRWARNSTTSPPSPLPRVTGVSDAYGWASCLEMFLIAHEGASPQSEKLKKAMMAAHGQGGWDLGMGDVWLEDILALRRAPPPIALGRWRGRPSDVDLEVTEFILRALAAPCREYPEPDFPSFNYFFGVYSGITNALVSEIVEYDREGAVWLAYQSGARVLPPDARSVFRTVAALKRFTEGDEWRGAPGLALSRIAMTWRGLITDLTDTIAVLNDDLDAVGEAIAYEDPKALKAAIDLASENMARAFDKDFYRLLLAELTRPFDAPRTSRDTRRLERMERAIEKIEAEKSGYCGHPAGLYADKSLFAGRLYGGQTEDGLAPVSTGHWDDNGYVIFR